MVIIRIAAAPSMSGQTDVLAESGMRSLPRRCRESPFLPDPLGKWFNHFFPPIIHMARLILLTIKVLI